MKDYLIDQPPQTIEALARVICSNDELRRNLHMPCIRDGRFMATDAHLGLDVPASLVDAQVEPNPQFPRLESIINRTFEGEFVATVSTDYFEKVMGRIPRRTINHENTCPTCEGVGTRYCDCCGHHNECEDCDGQGTWTAGERGEQYGAYQHVQVRDQLFDATKISLIPVLARIMDAATIDLYLHRADQTHYGQTLRMLGAQAGEARFVVMPMAFSPGYPDTATITDLLEDFATPA